VRKYEIFVNALYNKLQKPAFGYIFAE